jgi:hypothetical protein
MSYVVKNVKNFLRNLRSGNNPLKSGLTRRVLAIPGVSQEIVFGPLINLVCRIGTLEMAPNLLQIQCNNLLDYLNSINWDFTRRKTFCARNSYGS